MMFRSLVDRLLGSHESFEDAYKISTATRLSYERFPGLLQLAWNLLESIPAHGSIEIELSTDPESYDSRTEAIFLVLDLLRRAPPASRYRADMHPRLLQAKSCADWLIRDIASRTYANLFGDRDAEQNLAMLFPPGISQNSLHGSFLCVKNLLQLQEEGETSSVSGGRFSILFYACIA